MDQPSEEISLRELFDALWSRRLLIALLSFGFGATAAVVSLLMPEKYEASVVLSPVDDSGSGKLGGALLSQLGGLAGLAGLSGGASGQKSVALATLQSHALTESFIRDNNLLPVLYPDDWDASARRWLSDDPDDIPTPWKAEGLFAKKVRTIAEDKKTGLVTLTIEWTDPVLAAEWATELVRRANQTLRAKAIDESQRNLSYLNEQVAKTSVVELQRSIYALIESEIKKVMLAQGSDEYAFKVVDPARIAELRSSPKRTLITAVGLFAGLMIGFVLALALPRKPIPG